MNYDETFFSMVKSDRKLSKLKGPTLPYRSTFLASGLLVLAVALLLGPIAAGMVFLFSFVVFMISVHFTVSGDEREAKLLLRNFTIASGLMGAFLILPSILPAPHADASGYSKPVSTASTPSLFNDASMTPLHNALSQHLVGPLPSRVAVFDAALSGGQPLPSGVHVSSKLAENWYSVSLDGTVGCVYLVPGQEQVTTTCPISGTELP